MSSTLIVEKVQIEISRPKQALTGSKKIVIRADFQVAPGDRLAIQAPSGFGKSTLFRAIAGFIPVQSGRILLEPGWDLLPIHQRKVGFLFQDAALFPHLNVRENLEYALRLQGVGAEERRARAEAALARIGLKNQAEQSTDSLSGGERQRIALSRTWLIHPKLVLLDEPFSALDAGLQREMQDWVVELHRENPVPLLWITHDSSGLERVATRKMEGRQVEGDVRIFAAS
ncbi:MAG: ATP-binding cassette domain-containing protein [Bdellovibrionales bacterium]|nr:ATP-binding cassette domain-containing protein [Bdellovibrionales bacterium]